MPQTEPSAADGQHEYTNDNIDLSEAHDVELAVRVVQVHCQFVQYPETVRCLNCGWPFPCVSHVWARTVLLSAGWSGAGIAALDQRTGPWS